MNQVIYVFFLQVLLTKQMLLIKPSRSLLLIIPQAAWVGTSTSPLRNLNFYTWYEVESYTSDTPWQKKLINDIITFIMGHTCIYRPETKQRPDALFQVLWLLLTSNFVRYIGMTKGYDRWHYRDCHMTCVQFTEQIQNED